MTDDTKTAEVKARLRDACVGHPNAAIPWPHRLLHDAADTIEALERRVATIDEAPPGFAYVCERCGQTMAHPRETEGCLDPGCPATELPNL